MKFLETLKSEMSHTQRPCESMSNYSPKVTAGNTSDRCWVAL